MNLLSAAAGAVQTAKNNKKIPNILLRFIGCPPFAFEVSVCNRRMCSLREELRTRRSCSLGPFNARQSLGLGRFAVHFDFQSGARLEVEIKVKFTELVGRC